jgi:hypothetical protein
MKINYKIDNHTKKKLNPKIKLSSQDIEEKLDQDEYKKLIGSVYDEKVFNDRIDKILRVFVRQLNLESDEKKETYRKYFDRIVSIYYPKVGDRIKLKILDGIKIDFNPFNLEQFDTDIRSILGDIDERFNKLEIFKQEYSPNKKYTVSMFNYCISRKMNFNIPYELSSEDIPKYWKEIKKFNKASFLRSLSSFLSSKYSK